MIRSGPKSHVGQDNEETNNFKSQHEKGSCDQGSVADNINEVATYF